MAIWLTDYNGKTDYNGTDEKCGLRGLKSDTYTKKMERILRHLVELQGSSVI